MRIGSSSPQPFALPSPFERDSNVQKVPARERESLRQVDESAEEVSRNEPRRKPVQRVDAGERSQKQNFSRMQDFDEMPANNRNAIAAYMSTARLQSNVGAGELVGIDEIV